MFWIFVIFWDFKIFRIFLDFLDFFRTFSKLLRLLLKVTKVTTNHQKWPKIGQNSIIGSFFPPKKPQPKASAGFRSWLKIGLVLRHPWNQPFTHLLIDGIFSTLINFFLSFYLSFSLFMIITFRRIIEFRRNISWKLYLV